MHISWDVFTCISVAVCTYFDLICSIVGLSACTCTCKCLCVCVCVHAYVPARTHVYVCVPNRLSKCTCPQTHSCMHECLSCTHLYDNLCVTAYQKLTTLLGNKSLKRTMQFKQRPSNWVLQILHFWQPHHGAQQKSPCKSTLKKKFKSRAVFTREREETRHALTSLWHMQDCGKEGYHMSANKNGHQSTSLSSWCFNIELVNLMVTCG